MHCSIPDRAILCRASTAPPPACAGFTLLEMLAVVFVVGLMASVVVPQLPTMEASLDFALKRDSFEQQMNGLAYKAYKDGADFTLYGTYDSSGLETPGEKHDETTGDEISGRMRVLSAVEAPRVMLPSVTPTKVAPPLPEGWQMTVETPIQYRASGYCTGGEAQVDVKNRSYTYRFVPPLCEVVLEQ